MNKLKAISLALLAPVAIFADEASTIDVESVVTQTENTAMTVLTAAVGIGTIILAWKFVRKFFGKTG